MLLRRSRLPTFLVVGAMKAGTTSLHQYLKAHPQVFMAEPKELSFFVEQKNWGRGMSWYRRHFEDARGALAVGEASPQYAMRHCFPGVAERIARTVPEVRIVFVAREPVSRLQSHYLHDRASGVEDRPIEQAIRSQLGYLHTSRYAYQLEDYAAHLRPDQLLVLTSDDLRDRRAATLARVYDFIGVDPDFVPGNLGREAHATAAKAVDPSEAQLSEDDEAMLRDAFRPDVAELSRWLGDDFEGWGLLSG